ncbi:hypothetical protein E1181_11560 [Saccharopolyspora terrae]|uniref:PPE domain-containing protein n=1 Tax=Saccharopolyspora terrae TaxID=2530384 RepID=A0A4V2YBA8_9PSEU|nr:hypothetical protein E1181_11560 [Saccharopolyspora terrae]
MFTGLAGGETSAQEQARLAQEAAAKDGRQDLKALNQQQQNLQLNGHDPASITQQDNWKNWDQARLADQLKPSLNPEQIAKSGRAWEKLGNDIAEIFGDLDQKARAAAGDGMRGQAAEAGFNAAKPLQEWGRAFGDSVRGTGLKIQEAGVAAEQTKASLQPPAGYDTTRGVIATAMGPAGGLMDGAAQMREQQEADQQARQIAENVYGKGYQAVDTSTPTFPPPVNPLAPPPPPPGSGGGAVPGGSGSGSGGGGYSGSSVGGGSAGGSSGGSSPAQSSSQWSSPTPTGPGAGGGTPPGMNPGPGGPSAGFVGGMPPGAGAGAGGRGAGGMGGARGAGAGMGAGGKAGGGMGAGGRAGMGGLGAGAGAGAAGAGAAGRGAAGAPGAGAGAGQRGEGSEDNEHERPSWLEEQEDIWMDDMPKTAPPVFGE